MDADGSHRNLSKGDILYELSSQHFPVLNKWELEAGYAACQRYIEMTKAPTSLVLRLQFDCATRLGYRDEALKIASLASAYYEATAEMHSALREYGKMSNNSFLPLHLEEDTSLLEVERSQNTSTLPKNDKLKKMKKKKNKKKKKMMMKEEEEEEEEVDQQVPSFSSESEEEHWTSNHYVPSYQKSYLRNSIEGSESLLLENQQKQPAPAQIKIIYEPLEDIEVEKGERSIFFFNPNWSQGRHGFDWYRLNLATKEFSKVFGRLEWGGTYASLFGVATVGSIIYILGGLRQYAALSRSELDRSFCNDVFYLDVHNPRDEWKAGPQLPSPHFYPVATSMKETIYIFNGKYVFARALDTSDSESGWKPLEVEESPILGSLSDCPFVMAIPDPIRDRILLFTHSRGFFAYYPRYPHKKELECIQSELRQAPQLITRACGVVDGVLYYNEFDSVELLCAYDLGQRKRLIPVFSFKIDIAPYDYNYWDQLLDLGGGKLCLVRYLGLFKDDAHYLKLKVQKKVGGDKVHIVVVSSVRLRIVEDRIMKSTSFMRSFAI